MQLTILYLAIVIILTTLFIILLGKERQKLRVMNKELTQLKQNPDRSISVLNDLMNNNKVVLEVRKVDSSEIFLRSPKGL